MLKHFREKFRESFNAQKACKFLVGYYAWIEIVMVLYRKISYQFSASSYCLLRKFECKFITLFKDNGAQRNLKITYSSKLPHSRDFFTITACTVVQAVRCISPGPSQRKRAIFEPPQIGDPYTDFHET